MVRLRFSLKRENLRRRGRTRGGEGCNGIGKKPLEDKPGLQQSQDEKGVSKDRHPS